MARDRYFRQNLEHQERILDLENENTDLRRQIKDLINDKAQQYHVDSYYRNLDEEFLKLKRRIRSLQDAKVLYEEEQKREEIRRQERIKALELHPDKERRYLNTIDRLQLQNSELIAENYSLGEKFIEKDIKDRNQRIKIEEKEIEKQEKDIEMHKLKDRLADAKAVYNQQATERRDLIDRLNRKEKRMDEMVNEADDYERAYRSIEIVNKDLNKKYNDCLKNQIKLQSEIQTLHGALADEIG